MSFLGRLQPPCIILKLIVLYRDGSSKLNLRKAEYLMTGEGHDIILNVGIIKAVDQFNYLGSIMYKSVTCEKDVE